MQGHTCPPSDVFGYPYQAFMLDKTEVLTVGLSARVGNLCILSPFLQQITLWKVLAKNVYVVQALKIRRSTCSSFICQSPDTLGISSTLPGARRNNPASEQILLRKIALWFTLQVFVKVVATNSISEGGFSKGAELY
jgi:hypothetical protein